MASPRIGVTSGGTRRRLPAYAAGRPAARQPRPLAATVRAVVVARFQQERMGLKAMLAESVGLVVVGEAADAVEAARLSPLRPDAFVVDAASIDTSGVAEVARGLGVALVAVVDPEGAHFEPDEDGLSGSAVVRRGIDGPALAAATRAAAAGLTIRDRRIERPKASSPLLSSREREVLELVANGLPNKQIAVRLGISSHTAKFHVASLMHKLGAASRTEAVGVAMRRGIV